MYTSQNQNKMRPLSPRQTQFAGEYYPLLSAFLREHGLTDDAYDAVLDGYLGAVRTYTEKPAWCDGMNFEELAERSMLRALQRLRKKEELLQHLAPQSLEAPLRGSDGLALKDVLPSSEPKVESVIEMRITIQRICEVLPETRLKILKLWTAGYGPGQIAHCCRLSLERVKRELREMKQQIQQLVNDAV